MKTFDYSRFDPFEDNFGCSGAQTWLYSPDRTNVFVAIDAANAALGDCYYVQNLGEALSQANVWLRRLHRRSKGKLMIHFPQKAF